MKQTMAPETARARAAQWEGISRWLDVDYSYRLARRMEQYKTNDALGYRTAGSRAERMTGEMLFREMREMGLTVNRDEFELDGWDFHHARLSYQTAEGQKRTVELGGYQTQLDTQGPREYTLAHVGNATKRELDGLDLTGKLALVFINQRDDWWINYPAYAAHLKGAAAIIAVQSQGYGEINDQSLNAQDICGPREAAALSLSKRDAGRLMKEMGLVPGQEVKVTLDAKSIVTPGARAANIVGMLPGETEDMVLVTAHYDSYFAGFQDDNTAVALLLCMARALVKAEYKPWHTLVFCATAAEEWGVIDSRYDWSTGAYNQIFRVHPEWQGKVIADLNLELPAHAHGKKHKIRCVHELKSFLKRQIGDLPAEMRRLYPKGVDVICPTQTLSDDFSFAIAGIPALVNEFGSGKFMETHYHSQFDTDDAYDADIYAFHHQLYTQLLLAFDRTLLPPLDFSERLMALDASLYNQALPPRIEGRFRLAIAQALPDAKRLAQKIEGENDRFAALLENDRQAAGALAAAAAPRARALLQLFRACQDDFVGLDWNEQAIFPHENAQRAIDLMHAARWQLAVGQGKAALRSLRQVDDNRYQAFGREVADYFADRALNQPAERLMWGAGRLGPRLDLTGLIGAIKEKMAAGIEEFDEEIAALKKMQEAQWAVLEELIRRETAAVKQTKKALCALLPEKKPKKEKKKEKRKEETPKG